jgi:Xaa-Pro aminopeptidase
MLHCAQPTPATHPHLMAKGEVTPGIGAIEYEERRARLAESLPAGSMALFPSAARGFMSHDVPYAPYYQDTDLFYLCGLQEYSSLLACVKPTADAAAARWHLFVRPSSKAEEVWDGPRAGVAGAQHFFLREGAAHRIDDVARVLASELGTDGSAGGRIRSLYYSPRTNPEIDKRVRPALMDGKNGLGAQPAHRLVHALRLRKSAAEIALMRRSGDVGAGAMAATMRDSPRATTAGYTELALAAQFEFEAKLEGAERLAYPCVVAGGVNAVTLHYMHNNAPLNRADMLLMDAGSSLHGYCSDVTRTWPLSGRYSDAQRALYEAVLDVNERVIEACVADGTTTMNGLHRLSLQWTLEHLMSLGIASRTDPQLGSRVQRYFPHAIGHWLGLDVHDTPSMESSVPLEPGMVVTVEPGLYIPADDMSVPAEFRGIGIRIEDDVLVSAEARPAEVLTQSAPKRVADVEALLSSAITGV